MRKEFPLTFGLMIRLFLKTAPPIKRVCVRFVVPSRRCLSNDSFKETINKINQDFAKSTDDKSTSEKGEQSDNNQSPFDLKDKFSFLPSNSFSFVRDNFQQAWNEMTGKAKQSSLSRPLVQAPTFRQPKEKSELDVENEDISDYSGPTSIVIVKDPVSAWEQMKTRLQDSPFIREILKGTKRVGSAAAGTDLGKQAEKVGQSVKDKIEDAKEFWETSQNPLVYTLSGVWDNLTGETEEGLAIAEFRRLDPSFIKVIYISSLSLTGCLFKSWHRKNGLTK